MTPRAPEPGDVPPYAAYRPQLLRDDSTQSKLSVPLSSHSNEADDEQSSDPDADYDMESSADAPQYEGEDTRVTSDKELAGFYMYGWAAEVCYYFLALQAHASLSMHLHGLLHMHLGSDFRVQHQLTTPGIRCMRNRLLHTSHARAARARERRPPHRPLDTM
jgi:hypothetical protein